MGWLIAAALVVAGFVFASGMPAEPATAPASTTTTVCAQLPDKAPSTTTPGSRGRILAIPVPGDWDC